jgi:DNA-binding winged helix-turn-helix (wHTH) protein
MHDGQATQSDRAPLRFADFELRREARELLRAGRPVPLRAKAFDLLVVLLERAGQLVTKGQLFELVWPGVVVEEGSIAVQVATLRKVVGSHLVETVPGSSPRSL